MTYSKIFNRNDLLVKFDKMKIMPVDLEISNHYIIYLSLNKELVGTLLLTNKPTIKKTFEIIHLNNEKVIYFEVV